MGKEVVFIFSLFFVFNLQEVLSIPAAYPGVHHCIYSFQRYILGYDWNGVALAHASISTDALILSERKIKGHLATPSNR
ncbi:hypothetical protein QQP08_015239 [Theobroma cacao]|nr:hypothetical protein QQP08_015239 [Theobroma cacao]